MTSSLSHRSRRARAHRRGVGAVRVVAVVGFAATVLVGCGGGGSDADASSSTTVAARPAGCVEAPFTIELGAAGAATAPFDVADAAAQRVSVLPGSMAFDASEMAGLTSKAGVTPLGAYTVYVSDGEVPVGELSGSGFGTIADGSSTVAAVRILPATDGGFIEGEVVAPSTTLGYPTRSKQPPLSAAIAPAGTSDLEFTDDVTGTVTVLEVDEDSICIDVDLTVAGDGGGAMKGTILAAVTRAGDSFFLT